MTFITDFDLYWREKAPLIIAEISALRPTVINMDEIILLVLRRHTSDLRPQLLSYFTRAYANRLVVLKSEVPNTFRVSRKLSTTINKHLSFSEIRRDIKLGIKSSQSVYRTAQILRDKGLSKAAIPKYLKGLQDAARTTARLAHDPQSFLRLQKKIKNAQRNIDRLVDPSTSTLKRAYQDLIEASTTYSESSYAKAVQFAVKAKQKYQTERLVRNEVTRAYAEASQVDLKTDPDAIGWRSVLSSGDSACDICVDKATDDNYGLGPGGFPKRIPIGIPYHPGCQCSTEKIYR